MGIIPTHYFSAYTNITTKVWKPDFLRYHNQTVPIYLLGYDIMTHWVETEKGFVNIFGLTLKLTAM